MPFFGDYNEAMLNAMQGRRATGRGWGASFGRTHGRLARHMGAPFRGAAAAYRGTRGALGSAAGGIRAGLTSSIFSRTATGMMWGMGIGTIFDQGIPGPLALGMGIVGAGIGAMGPGAPREAMLTGRQASISNRKLWDRTRGRMIGGGSRLIGAGLMGMIGGGVAGPLGAAAGIGIGLAPGMMMRLGAGAFNVGAGAIGLGGRAALATAGGFRGRFARGATGAVIGGMMGGLPGAGVGMLAGVAGKFANTTPLRAATSFFGRHPMAGGLVLGGLLSVPTIARGLMGMAMPDPEMMDISMGSNARVMGLDSNNADTLGLTLALHYRR